MVIASIQDVFSQKQVQVMMTVLMDEIIDQIKAIAVEEIDERQSGPVTVAETHDSPGPQGNHTGRQASQEGRTFRPGPRNSHQAFLDLSGQSRSRRDHADGLEVLAIKERGPETNRPGSG
jgi:hypothetical protein